MQQPQPLAQPFGTLIHQIETGAIKIPQFQRAFVWDLKKSTKLLDSLLKGYPIGTFIFWRTKDELRSIRNLGGIELPPTPKGDYIHYVLDGQQRLTTLFVTVKGLKIERGGQIDDFSKMYIDLEVGNDGDIVLNDVSNKLPLSFISVSDLLSAEFTTLARFPEQYHTKMQRYKRTLEGYNFSVILVPEAPIDVATEIFTRLNVFGQPLSVFEIMVAKTYSVEPAFDLAEKTSELLAALSDAGYGTIPDIVILQAISAIMVKECSKREILRLDKGRFINAWPAAVEAIRAAVDYFRQVFRIPVSQLLPYNSLLVPFAYFFSRHADRPTGDMQQHLQDLFWRVSLGGYYSQSLETRVSQDVKRIDTILEGKLPQYDYPVDTRKEFILENGEFKTGRSFVKAILCLLAARHPRSFLDNAEVNISNDWLKQANSRNYHHFFPRAYLRRLGEDDHQANHIGNITLVDEFLNKREIRDRKPSDYMRKYKKENAGLARTMSTHLIVLEKFGVWEDNYDRFLDQRCNAIAKELSKRVIYQAIDDRGQVPTLEDYEDPEVAERQLVPAEE
ncbi:MAG: DUF262 domain-containing protein [Chloroflexi bacterium]|nr:DUF262 domain-containing protein [Chloroflexota bacterium]